MLPARMRSPSACAQSMPTTSVSQRSAIRWVRTILAAAARPDRVSPDPKVSVVAATRNDDHGGNQLARTQIFINGLAEQALRLRLPIELVLVEWNPPADRPPLSEAMSWPRSEWFDPKIVVVPPEVHRTFAHADGLPLFQMIAKNVGIRRSSAPFWTV